MKKIKIKKKVKKDIDEKEKKVKVKKEKKKKEKRLLTKFEFVFCLLSILCALGVGLYYGGRSFYYYSLQNAKKAETANTLNGLILGSNYVQQEGNGLHQNTDGYYFKGNVDNNYVKFANRLFRIISVSNEESVKLVSNDLVASFFWGKETDYNKSNLKLWLTDETYGIYNATIPSKETFLDKTPFTIDVLKDDKVEKGEEVFSDYVTTLSLYDYNLAGGKSSYLFDGKMHYLLGTNEDNEVLYTTEDGGILSCDGTEGYGIKSVITLKPNIPVLSGDGTKDNPYVIDQRGKTNFVDAYVKLGDDMWKVSHDLQAELIRLYKVGYVTMNGQDYWGRYSDKSCNFEQWNGANIANYLNYGYYESLSYKNVIASSVFNLGEFSEDTDFSYANIYTNPSYHNVGLLNIFDYVSENQLNNYYNLNKTSSVGGIQYVKYSNGFIEEVDVKEARLFVPVISIRRDAINVNSGDGSLLNPYTVG